jgi:oligogalacturonide lyase
VEPQRVTHHPTANEQLLYFTSSSLLADNQHLVFISDRTGNPNLFIRHVETGEEIQLTHNDEGYLKSYVYFDGIPYRGLGKASVSLHAHSGTAYYLQGRRICRVRMGESPEVIAEYPPGQMTAFTHVSADGTRLCVPTTDARALDGEKRLSGRPDYNIDQRVRTENLRSYLRVFDTTTGEMIQCEDVPRAWITHVQFSPANPDWILYNHEWPDDCGIRRIWLWDGHEHRRLRTEEGGRSREDWTCHEMWERDGRAVIYHGTYAGGRAYIGRVKPDGTQRIEIPLPKGWDQYGHFTVGKTGTLVSDGYFRTAGGADADHSPWISRVDVDWKAGRAEWTPRCRHNASWDSQDSHPHPIFDHATEYVYFTSDREGKRAVYRVLGQPRDDERS